MKVMEWQIDSIWVKKHLKWFGLSSFLWKGWLPLKGTDWYSHQAKLHFKGSFFRHVMLNEWSTEKCFCHYYRGCRASHFLLKTYLSLTFNLSAFLPNQIPHGRKAAVQERACGAIGVYPHSNHLFILLRQLPVTTHQVDKKRETSCWRRCLN